MPNNIPNWTDWPMLSQVFPELNIFKKENNLIVNEILCAEIFIHNEQNIHDAQCTSKQVWKVNFKVFILTAFGTSYTYK